MDFRRRKWSTEAVELVHRALVHNGFRAREATRALDVVTQRHGKDVATLTTEAILREALAVLT
jgi:hypothetical protein